ncbi:nucleotidyltransferase domain-containing protein [Actinoplanes sp. RD1]|uniref:nucleotidyltransferase domain-containing protein n=1 Tax=Actinoplanes sp. RD1 TaxID=3064538 RepID=UPI0027407C43|nr:nucleotidyltransferase domain-containing protein [Actinoplanes sp. RD1]
MSAYEQLLARARADPRVAGLILTGSHARGLATAHSDHDVLVVVDEYAEPWATATRTPQLDTIPVTLAGLADTSDRWQRYAFRGAQVLLDRRDGLVGRLVHAQATLTAAERGPRVREQLDGYLNFVYRAAKNRRDGHPDLARLEQIEAAPWLLETLFALYGRIRPYNKYLRWELATHPLPEPWTADLLIGAATGDPAVVLGPLERLARAEGFGDVLDGWDLTLMISR